MITYAIVCLNSEKTIDITLVSILKVISSEDEILIIDGGSNDKTLDIIYNLIKNVNHKIISEKDSGIFDAMNKAINNSSKEYIMYINSGDEVGEFENIQSANEILKRDRPDLLYGKSNFYSRINNIGYLVGRKVELKDFKYLMPICHQSILCKVDTLKLIGGFNTYYKVASDYELFIRIFSERNLKKLYINLVLSNFWIDDFNWKNSPISFYERYLIVKKHFKGLNLKCLIYCTYLSFRYYVAIVVKKFYFYQLLRRLKISILR